MDRKVLIENIVEKIGHLPDEKIMEVNDFTEFLLSKIEDRLITEGITKLASDSKSFNFLESEEDLYTVNDLKERYK
jgi:hypothetical protein